MELSKERIGELAMLILVEKFEKEGLMLKPKETKRQIINASKKLGVPVAEFAAFTRNMCQILYTRVIDEASTF